MNFIRLLFTNILSSDVKYLKISGLVYIVGLHFKPTQYIVQNQQFLLRKDVQMKVLLIEIFKMVYY